MRPYEGLIYFKGKLKSVKNNTIRQKKKYGGSKYNLLSYNCLDMTIDFLNKGRFEKYNHEYHVALGYAMSMSIPNYTFSGMYYFDETIDSYMKASNIRRLFINPYRVFKYTYNSL